MAWATVSQVKEEAGISTSGDDDLIERLIDAAQARLEKDCDRAFAAAANTTRYFHPIRDVTGRTLWLDKDLASINSITNGDGTTVTSTQYMTEPRNAVTDGLPIYAITLYANSGVNWQYSDDPDEDQIAISGKWAYSASAGADAIETLIQYAIWLYRRKDSGNQADSDRAFMMADGVVILPNQTPAFVKEFVNRYRRRPVLV